MPVNTKQADRRTLQFTTLDDLTAELDRLEASESTLRTTGNWSPGQILSHLAEWIDGYLDNITVKIPLPLKLIGPLFKKRFMTRGYAPGLPVPGGMLPPECTFEDGLRRLRTALLRIDAGESLGGPNPFFGTLTHDEAVEIHLRHCEHHLGYLHSE